jgi:hypothetical protein
MVDPARISHQGHLGVVGKQLCEEAKSEASNIR